MLIGPSTGEFEIARDLAQAAASTSPFAWCFRMNIRTYLGAGEFDGRQPGVPHDWCTMPEAWLGGSEDETSRRKGEMSLGPSLWVQRLALRVLKQLGLAHKQFRPTAVQTELASSKDSNRLQRGSPLAVLSADAAAEPTPEDILLPDEAAPPPRCERFCDTREEPWAKRCSWDRCHGCAQCPKDTAAAEHRGQGEELKQNDEANGPCTADHGEDKPCCGQDELDPRDGEAKDVRPCPESAPVCVDYIYGRRFGQCMAQAPPAAPPASVVNEATDGRCTADHGGEKPCCMQIDPRAVPDVRPCPKSAPVCVGCE